MACIEQVKLQVFQVALVRMRTLGREDVIVLAPHDQRWRLGFGKKQIRGSSECYPVFLDDLRISLIRRPMESQ